ncbi:MAG: prenyltransferase/squalene oxidase repeat-containing protein [Bacteroidia bacterium]
MKTFVSVSLAYFLMLFFAATPPEPTQVKNVDPDGTEAVIHKGIEWLVKAQFENGGWGAGTHANQGILDPKAVQVDPATTAFAAMALLRAGNTLHEGEYKTNLRKALNFLLEEVEKSPAESVNITSLTGTQPQVKLGQNIDVSMTSRFFTRILPFATDDPALTKRINQAQDKCLSKIQRSQNADGSIQGGTWAGVLQSAVANIALEEAAEAGYAVDSVTMIRSKDYQKMNIDATSGAVVTDKSAGVQLYSLSSTTRATAKSYKKAKEQLETARDEGVFDDMQMSSPSQAIPMTEENLRKTGMGESEVKAIMQDVRTNEIARKQVQTDQVMAGFGNNGGEEFLSHMMTSESMVLSGGEEWTNWNNRMKTMMTRIQNPDGSWSGHHCITSPVFCTAAALLTITVDQDKSFTAERQ